MQLTFPEAEQTPLLAEQMHAVLNIEWKKQITFEHYFIFYLYLLKRENSLFLYTFGKQIW